MFWQLICDKKYYSFEEILLCAVLASFVSLNLLVIGSYLLTKSVYATTFLILGLCCIFPAVAANSYYNGDVNFTNLFCIKKPKKGQLHKIALQFIAYSIPILALLSNAGLLSVLVAAMTNIYQATPIYITLLSQTYWEEAIFRLFLIKGCVDEDNNINNSSALMLSLASSVLFTYAHRYNGYYLAIKKSTSFLKACIINFLSYSGAFLIVSIDNLMNRYNIVPSWVLHYYNNVIAFTLAFRKSEYNRAMSGPKPTIANSFKTASIEGLFVAIGGGITLKALNFCNIDTEVNYAESNMPSPKIIN